MVREVEITRNWFGRIFVIFLNVVRENGMHLFSLFFQSIFFFAQSAGYVLDEITGDACKSVIDFDGLFRTRDLDGNKFSRNVPVT